MITSKQILKEVSKFKGISIKDIKGGSRKTEIAEAKHLFFYACNHYKKSITPRYSLERTGNEIGLTHATVLNSIKRYESLLEWERLIKDEWEVFKMTLETKHTLNEHVPRILRDDFINQLRATKTNDEWRKLIINHNI